MKDERRSDGRGKVRLGCFGLLSGLLFGACGAPTMIGPEPNEPSTDPEAAGADEHQAAALREDERLARHQALYDPRATKSLKRCDPEHAQRHQGAADCWVEAANPTAIHQWEMAVHNERAAYHRKAARDLRAAEAQNCAGVAGDEHSLTAFAQRGDILGVNPLQEASGEPNGKPQIVGATIFVRPAPDLTADGLRRAMNCYSAREAARGYGLITTEAERSPLGARGTRVTVREVSIGFAVDVRADDEFAAQAVWLRAQRLALLP
jgi:hypothetical protein